LERAPPGDSRLLFGSKLHENVPTGAHPDPPGWLDEQAARAVVVKVEKTAGWLGTHNLVGFPAWDLIQDIRRGCE